MAKEYRYSLIEDFVPTFCPLTILMRLHVRKTVKILQHRRQKRTRRQIKEKTVNLNFFKFFMTQNIYCDMMSQNSQKYTLCDIIEQKSS